ncbi:hypothetical protein U3516DRAFT_755904 [Neocallimastix sp. 'constans']
MKKILKIFHKELNNECNPKVLLEIAKGVNQSYDNYDKLGYQDYTEFYKIIIVNKYLIDELLKEKDDSLVPKMDPIFWCVCPLEFNP